MRVGIASDHRGVRIKEELVSYLEELGYEILDFGPAILESTNYPHYAFLVGEKVASQEVDLGVLICGTGIGMSIAANKVKGVRCAKVDNMREAVLARSHNNANIIALSAELKIKDLKNLARLFLEASYTFEDRHNTRIQMISEYENGN